MKKMLSCLVILAAAVTGVFFFHPGHSGASFVANDLMSDGIFDNTNYSAAQIDAFLNTFPNSCISTNHGFTAAEPIGYSASTGHFSYGNYVSAGTVIYDAAIAYSINPRVLLATMEKEQNLFTGNGSRCNNADANTRALAYAASMGYNCPDGGTTYDAAPNPSLYAINGVAVTSVSGTCVAPNNQNQPVYVGFSPQVIVAAWKLKFNEQRSEGNTSWDVQLTNFPHSGDVWNNSDDPPTTYSGPMTQGTFARVSGGSTATYDGYTTIDSTSVRMDTGATASLYYYTPHFAGNQNFVSIYETNFGPTKGLDYAFQYVSTGFSGASTSANVQGNTQVTVTVTLENVGNQSWSNSNAPVRIGTWAPTDHNSALHDSSWLAYNRLAGMNQTSVLPGNNATFTFKIDVPNVTEGYTEAFNLVAEGATWFPGSGFELQLNITKSNYTWGLVSESSTNGFALNPGETSQFTLIAKNTGNVTWNNSSTPLRLATWAPSYRSSAFYSNDNTGGHAWINPNRAADLSEATVAPGANGTFVFNVRAPSTPGFYVERFNLVMEGVAWFDDPWVEFDINVVPLTWRLVSQSAATLGGGSPVSFSFNRGDSATLTLTAQNTGYETWTNSPTTPVRLATWNPPYRTSNFFSSDNTGGYAWINQYRAAVLNESSVAPGQNGTFSFNIKVPSSLTPGLYVERFNLVMENVAWFTDPWMEFDISVH